MDLPIKDRGLLVIEKEGVVRITSPSPFTNEEKDSLRAAGWTLKNKVTAMKVTVNLDIERPGNPISSDVNCSGVYMPYIIMYEMGSKYPHICCSG